MLTVMWQFLPQFIFLIISVQQFISIQACSLPLDTDEFKTIFEIFFVLLPPGTTFGDSAYYTCMAQDSLQNEYRELAVIMPYSHNDMEGAKQLELECVNGEWNARAGGDVPESFNYTSITARTDCSSCHNAAGNDYFCQACDPTCNTGSMRCTGSGSEDCCPFFTNQLACTTTTCDADEVVGEFTDYRCVRSYCTLPTTDVLTSLLGSLFEVLYGLIDAHFTCLTQGFLKGHYSQLTVILEYLDRDTVDRVVHLPLECNMNREWQVTNIGSNTFKFLPNTNYNHSSIRLRTDCQSCTTTDPQNPCEEACPDECNVQYGLNRCTLVGKCCMAFEDDGLCKTHLNCNKQYFTANEANNFTCSPCELSSCPDGYTVENSTCTCTLTDVCVADNPCNNNGVCILDTAPDQYTCNCTGTGYTGTNCTDIECTLTCLRGYVVNNDCMTCVLDNICVADNPCSNGGTCVLGSSPHEYSCQCTNQYSGINCTECSLECLNRGSVDEYCISCNCSTGYTGSNCSECDTGYSVNGEGRSCTLTLNDTSSSGTGDDSSFKWWHVGLPVILILVLVLVTIAIVIIVGMFVWKNKHDRLKLISEEVVIKFQ